MCLIAFAWQASAEFPFALVANRDEFHARPTEGLGWWADADIAAGRDLQAGGTWLGINKNGRIAAVTNVREGHVEQTASLSRGLLVTHALNSADPLDAIEEQLGEMGRETAGFNILFGDLFGSSHELRYLTNRGRNGDGQTGRFQLASHPIKSGVYALSNAGLGDDWPKTLAAERAMRRALRHRHPDQFWEVTNNREVAPVEDLPDTGVDQDLERFLSSSFIVGDAYGTRSTLRILGQPRSGIVMTERRYDNQGDITGSSQIRIAPPE
ncbi:MAG: NRDE family protein [Gammaproteobacteria bacterium]